MNATATPTLALTDIHPRFQKAFNDKNLDALIALYEPDAVFVNIDGAVLQGHDQIRAAYRKILTDDVKIILTTAGVFDNAAGLALMHAKWTLRGTGPDGQPLEQKGTSAELVRRHANGVWLYAVDNPLVPLPD